MPASRAVWTTQSTMRRPSSGCRCFGVALFMRVPRPPAITTAARSSAMVSVSGRRGWGARIRTWDHGTKTRCLTAWPRPRAMYPETLAPVEEEEDERHDREDDDCHDHGPLDDPAEDHGDQGEELRGGEDPEQLPDGGRSALAPGDPADDGDDRKHDHRPAGDVVREEDDDRLDRGDPERNADALGLEPAARAGGSVVDHRLGIAAQHGSTVPRWWRYPGLRTAPKRARRGRRVSPVMEEAVDGRTGAADVCAEGTECPELVDDRRPREVVLRERREVTRPPHPVDDTEELRAPLVEPCRAVARVEGAVDVRRRLLRRPVREYEKDPEILR